MSLELSPVRQGSPPYRMKLVLQCDDPGHTKRNPPSTATFYGASLISMLDLAKETGWSRITGGNTRGPCCGER